MSNDIADLAQSRLGYTFSNPDLLLQALTHASMTADRRDSNERLEFLGDAILGLVCCEMVFTAYPELLEGEMTKVKSLVVSRQTCAMLAREVGLESLLRIGKGMLTQKVLPHSLAAGTLESVVGAIYVDGGIDPVRAFLSPRLEPLIRSAAASGHQDNFKSLLQQHAQQRYQGTAVYIVLDEKGPDHSKCFEMCVEIGERRFGSCWGTSKKQAEQQAALIALNELGVTEQGADGRVRVVGLAEGK